MPTFPTAASPSSTSLTLLLGFGADAAAESVMSVSEVCGLFARKLRPTPYADSLEGDYSGCGSVEVVADGLATG